jgi:hypothetical protein
MWQGNCVGMEMDKKLTKKEQAAISELEKLSKHWPKTLWIFCTGMSMNVMRKNADGVHAATPSGGMDQDCIVANIDIENDGGDW